MDAKKVAEGFERQMREAVGDKIAVLGLSGGVDSSVVAAICQRALGKDNVLAVMMPYGNQSTTDAERVAKLLGIPYIYINIKSAVDSSVESLKNISTFYGDPNSMKANGMLSNMLLDGVDTLTSGNMRARERMKMLYAISGIARGMVIGTGNKTEIYLGYYTKYGDGGVDLLPIGDCLKREVRELAAYYGYPDDLVNRVPSAELWEGQTDEGEIGATYEQMDTFVDTALKGSSGLMTTAEADAECLRVGITDEVMRRLANRLVTTSHKRRTIPVFVKE